MTKRYPAPRPPSCRRPGVDLGRIILVLLLALGLGLLTLAGRQVVLHLQSLSWQPVSAELLELGREQAFQGDGPVPIGVGSRFTGRYRYVWDGRIHEGSRLSFSTSYTRSRSTADAWEARLERHLGSPGDSLTVWVDPRQPDRSVAFRDVRWLEVGSAIGFGLLLTLIGLNAWGPQTSPVPGAFSWRSVAKVWVTGGLLGVLAPLLWRDGHPVWASVTVLPLIVAIHGTIYGLRRSRQA